MEEKGLIRRMPDPHDNRQIIVLLSEKGKALLEESYQKFLDYVENVLEQMGEDDAREYVRLQ
ncbi:MAG: hypothetical protein LIO74_05605 [Ruminococcus sp.]|nr:hypothetical protein [Ruminococcus sp.]